MRISEKFNSFNGSSRYVTQQDLSALLRRLAKKIRQRLAIGFRTDALLRHLGAGRVGGRPDLEQPRDRFRRPHAIERGQRRRKFVAGQRRDSAPETARRRWARAIAFIVPYGRA